MKFLELQIYNSENYKYEIMRIPIMVYESRIKGQGTTGAHLRIFLHPILWVHRAGSQVIIGIVQVSVFVW